MADKNTQAVSVNDRFIITSLIPQEGNMINLIMYKELRKKLEFSKEEFESIDLVEVEGAVRYNPVKAEKIAKEIEFTASEKEFIKQQLMKLDTEQKLTESHIDCYNAFVK